MPDINELKPYLIALAVGFLVGIERENAHSAPKALGVRTFLLLGLLGALSGSIESAWNSSLITGFVLALILTSYILQKYSKSGEVHLGITTEIAGAIVFASGFIAHTSPVIAATIGPVVAIVLFSKITLHRFTHSIKADELKAAITILLIAAVVLDLAPDQTIDPWGFFNPRKFGYLVLTLAGLEFLSYISYKFIGEKKSLLVIGMLGGFVSSTVVMLSASRKAKIQGHSWRSLAITSLAAQLTSFIELLIIVGLVSSNLLLQVSMSILPVIVFLGISIFILIKKVPEQMSNVELKSPLDWKGVFRLSVIFTFLLTLISAAQHWIGKEATLVLSFLAGLFELQGISLANATMFAEKQVGLQTAIECICLAIAASLTSKIAISWSGGKNDFSIFVSIYFSILIGLLAITATLILKNLS